VELFFLDGSYIGLELIERNRQIFASCCHAPRWHGSGPAGPALRGHLASALPSLAERLEGAEPLWDKPLAVVCPSAGTFIGKRGTAVYRVGDRIAHIPPFTGDGLRHRRSRPPRCGRPTFGTASPDAYLASARQLTAGPIRLASIVSGLARSSGGRTYVGVGSLRAWPDRPSSGELR